MFVEIAFCAEPAWQAVAVAALDVPRLLNVRQNRAVADVRQCVDLAGRRARVLSEFIREAELRHGAVRRRRKEAPQRVLLGAEALRIVDVRPRAGSPYGAPYWAP
eukprot:CAMPEP_0206798528 /NCGR_PEP_ID=MMETSP0975-20121206/716_1 /ASSEMBLY_ACC=CAM_ASM_000399 /TAXON_ID=483370 /ORGANISM="non described non described, Strain CCMP2097" /LENGTH=104 /DNA_ID=CAMNT_0054340477 /DNA_START=10 /DNA_END=324 /DNA_ORIENTATION=+